MAPLAPYIPLPLIRERSSITSARWRGVGGLTEIADAADALRGVGGLRSKLLM